MGKLYVPLLYSNKFVSLMSMNDPYMYIVLRKTKEQEYVIKTYTEKIKLFEFLVFFSEIL